MVRFSIGSIENSTGQLQPSQAGVVVVVLVVAVVVSTSWTLEELDTELVEGGSTADVWLAELEADNATDKVLDDVGATVTVTGNLKLEDECEEHGTEEEEELDDSVAV